MADLESNPTPTGDDPLAHLHKMSTTAGLGTTDYVAVNGMAVVAIILGIASALAFFDWVLLAVPIVAILIAVIALWQIGSSNGTQTGKILAISGIILALLFVGLVGGKKYTTWLNDRADEKSINELISKLDQRLRAGEYDEAYALFHPKFVSRFNRQTFVDVWRPMVAGASSFGKLTSVHSNGRMDFEYSETEQKIGYSLIVMEFGAKSSPGEMLFKFIKQPDGAWKIVEVPDLFHLQTEQTPKKLK